VAFGYALIEDLKSCVILLLGAPNLFINDFRVFCQQLTTIKFEQL
jgi:hypothetical protein